MMSLPKNAEIVMVKIMKIIVSLVKDYQLISACTSYYCFCDKRVGSGS